MISAAAPAQPRVLFFNHFNSKEELSVAAADHWSLTTGELFAHAPYHEHDDPLERVLAYIEFRKSIIAGSVPDFLSRQRSRGIQSDMSHLLLGKGVGRDGRPS